MTNDKRPPCLTLGKREKLAASAAVEASTSDFSPIMTEHVRWLAATAAASAAVATASCSFEDGGGDRHAVARARHGGGHVQGHVPPRSAAAALRLLAIGLFSIHYCFK